MKKSIAALILAALLLYACGNAETGTDPSAEPAAPSPAAITPTEQPEQPPGAEETVLEYFTRDGADIEDADYRVVDIKEYEPLAYYYFDGVWYQEWYVRFRGASPDATVDAECIMTVLRGETSDWVVYDIMHPEQYEPGRYPSFAESAKIAALKYYYDSQTEPMRYMATIIEMLQRERVRMRDLIIGAAVNDEYLVEDARNSARSYQAELRVYAALYRDMITTGEAADLFDEAMRLYDTSFQRCMEELYEGARAGADAEELYVLMREYTPDINRITDNFGVCMDLYIDMRENGADHSLSPIFQIFDAYRYEEFLTGALERISPEQVRGAVLAFDVVTADDAARVIILTKPQGGEWVVIYEGLVD